MNFKKYISPFKFLIGALVSLGVGVASVFVKNEDTAFSSEDIESLLKSQDANADGGLGSCGPCNGCTGSSGCSSSGGCGGCGSGCASC